MTQSILLMIGGYFPRSQCWSQGFSDSVCCGHLLVPYCMPLYLLSLYLFSLHFLSLFLDSNQLHTVFVCHGVARLHYHSLSLVFSPVLLRILGSIQVNGEVVQHPVAVVNRDVMSLVSEHFLTPICLLEIQLTLPSVLKKVSQYQMIEDSAIRSLVQSFNLQNLNRYKNTCTHIHIQTPNIG